MAKVLTFRRSTSEVMTLDTINNKLVALGAALPNVETTTAFPLRAENLIVVYRGDPYLLYLHDTNEIRLSRYSSGAWADVAGFTAITAVSGNMTPTALNVVQDYLVAVCQESDSVGVDKIIARRSQDGVVWDPITTKLMTTQPVTNQGGHSIVWRNAVFVATADGVVYYDALSDAWSASFDVGNDAMLTGLELTAGNFAFWNNALYFVKPNVVPTIYQIDSAFDLGAPPASPMWTNLLPTGIPGLGTVTVGPDTNTFLLFVNKQDELCLLYSALLGTKLIKASAALFPLFDDVTDDILDPAISGAANLSFSLFVDDRRRANELQSILIRNVTAVTTQLATWDGVSTMDVRATFAGEQLSFPDDRFSGELRLFTNLQPTTFFDGMTQPTPGRVLIDYTVRDSGARPVDVFGEYSIDGDEWLPMTQGDGDDGNSQLPTSLAGISYQFMWDAYADLDGDYDNMLMRIVSRIANV